MKHMRLRIIFLLSWIALILALDFMMQPNLIHRLEFFGMVSLALLVLLFQRISFWLVAGAPVLLNLTVKVWSGQFAAAEGMLIALVETLMITITAFLAVQVGQAILEFETSILNITIGHRDRIPETAVEGQAYLYREIRRARNHQRSLALLAIAPENHSIQMKLDRLVQAAQQSMIQQYTLSAVSRTLCEKLEDCDIIVQRNHHFLVLLPETSPEDLPRVIGRLREQVSQQVGVDLKIGMAILPNDGFTLEGLIELATAEMNDDSSAAYSVEFEKMSAGHNIS